MAPYNPQLRDEFSERGNKHETNLAGDQHNVDTEHELEDSDQYSVKAKVIAFLDAPLRLPDAIELASEALAEDVQVIAEVIDSCVNCGLFKIRGEFLVPAQDLTPEVPSEEELEHLYHEWLTIQKRHPEWKAKIDRTPGQSYSIDSNDPLGSAHQLRDVFRYDLSSVKPEDEAEFQKFLEVDSIIEEYEKGQGEWWKHKGSLLRKFAQSTMVQGKILKMGFVTQSNDKLPNIADMIIYTASDMALEDFGVELNTLPLDQQNSLLEKAEAKVRENNPLFRVGELGMDGEEVPPPDTNAPQGYEKVTDQSGKSHYRPKGDPTSQVKIERPEDGASGGF